MGELDAKTAESRIFRAILENTTAVVYAKDRDGRYQLVNRRFEEIFNFPADYVLGRNDFDLFSPEIAEKLHLNDGEVATSNAQIEFEEEVEQGNELHTYVSLKFPYRNEQGVCIGICGISTDITARKKAEAALIQSEMRFRQLAENVPECFWVRDAKTWRVLYVNSAFERIWGIRPEALQQNSEAWIDAIHSADRQRVRDAFFANAAGGSYKIEYRIVRPDSSIRWIADQGFPIYDEAGTVYRVAGIAEDISARRELEQQVTEISSRERQRISHELHDSLGQQLTGIGYLAKRLTKRLSVTPENKEAAEDILHGVQESLAEVRRIVRGLAPVGEDGYGLGTALEELAGSIKKFTGLTCDFYCPNPVRIESNTVATELFRIAQEAANNAVKHAGATRITISLLAEDHKLKLIVVDDGHGDEDLDQMEGMGLRIMRYRSRIIDGELKFASNSGGTSVACTLDRLASHE